MTERGAVLSSCEPCEVIGKYTGVADPYALRDSLRGRRGMLSKVVAVTGQGLVRRGDAVVVETAEDLRLPVES